MASTYLTRAFTAGNRKTFTMSAWFKLAFSSNSNNVVIFNADTDSGADHDGLRFTTDNKLQFFSYNGSFQCNLITNRLFRDTNAWYHVVVAVDTTQSTNSDRVKIYVNGIQETSFSTSTYPSQNYDFTEFNNASHNLEIGARGRLSEQYFDGSMSHIHWIDGTAYQASTFGSTDATTGEWKINTSPSVTYGTNGFFILKDGNSVTDQSGQSNNLTVGAGTLTKTEDNPSNVFATLNPLVPDAGSSGLFHGNNQLNVNTANWRSAFST